MARPLLPRRRLAAVLLALTPLSLLFLFLADPALLSLRLPTLDLDEDLSPVGILPVPATSAGPPEPPRYPIPRPAPNAVPPYLIGVQWDDPRPRRYMAEQHASRSPASTRCSAASTGEQSIAGGLIEVCGAGANGSMPTTPLFKEVLARLTAGLGEGTYVNDDGLSSGDVVARWNDTMSLYRMYLTDDGPFQPKVTPPYRRPNLRPGGFRYRRDFVEAERDPAGWRVTEEEEGSGIRPGDSTVKCVTLWGSWTHTACETTNVALDPSAWSGGGDSVATTLGAVKASCKLDLGWWFDKPTRIDRYAVFILRDPIPSDAIASNSALLSIFETYAAFNLNPTTTRILLLNDTHVADDNATLIPLTYFFSRSRIHHLSDLPTSRSGGTTCLRRAVWSMPLRGGVASPLTPGFDSTIPGTAPPCAANPLLNAYRRFMIDGWRCASLGDLAAGGDPLGPLLPPPRPLHRMPYENAESWAADDDNATVIITCAIDGEACATLRARAGTWGGGRVVVREVRLGSLVGEERVAAATDTDVLVADGREDVE
ncbi:hypothetical protein HK101_005766, partial [Irineochytrium annulatum]